MTLESRGFILTNRTVLISGSREANAELLQMVRAGVLKVWFRHDELLVGDAAGVDNYAVQQAENVNLHYMAYGIQRLARNGARRYTNVRSRLNTKYVTSYPQTLYRLRDEFMVQQADVVLCFWNERSNGTKFVFEYACALEREAYLISANGLIETSIKPKSPSLTLPRKQGREFGEVDFEKVR